MLTTRLKSRQAKMKAEMKLPKSKNDPEEERNLQRWRRMDSQTGGCFSFSQVAKSAMSAECPKNSCLEQMFISVEILYAVFASVCEFVNALEKTLEISCLSPCNFYFRLHNSVFFFFLYNFRLFSLIRSSPFFFHLFIRVVLVTQSLPA